MKANRRIPPTVGEALLLNSEAAKTGEPQASSLDVLNPLQLAARKAMRQALRDQLAARNAMREAFRNQPGEVCVVLQFANSGDVLVAAGGAVVGEFNLHALRRSMRADYFAIVEMLLTQLERQSTKATVAGVVASEELAVHQGRRRGAPKGGKETRRPERKQVEARMQAALLAGVNPRTYFATWVNKYGYSRRHLVNILNAVEGA